MYLKPILTTEHKKIKHLTIEERYLIQFLYCRNYTAYVIAKEIGCASNTIHNEINRGLVEYCFYNRP